MHPRLTHTRPVLHALEARLAPAVVLSDNFTNASDGILTATANDWLATSFQTDADPHAVTRAELLLSNPQNGWASLSIYSDSGNAPGALVGTLNPPGNYTTGLFPITFLSAGIDLQPNATYWAVFKPTGGLFEWATTSDTAGGGVGFLGANASSADGGATWANSASHPLLMRLTADEVFPPGNIDFFADGGGLSEEAGEVRIAIQRSGGFGGTVSVRVTSSDLTAIAGVDYEPIDEVVTFAPGQTSASVAFRPINDTRVESNEQLRLTLSDVTGGATLTGRLVQTITISDQDPRVGLTAVAAGSGTSTVTVYNPDSTVRRTFTSGTPGGVRVATADVTGDGIEDVIVGAGPGQAPTVEVYDGESGALLRSFLAFEGSFTGGVYVSAGDLNADSFSEFVVTPDEGGGPVVAVYSGADFAAGRLTELRRFLGIDDANFRGGVRTAIGYIDADEYVDLVVAAGFGGGPRVALLNGRDVGLGNPSPRKLFPDFFAFEERLRNGAFVAVGDTNNDRRGEIAFGGGPGGAPRLRVFDSGKLLLAGSFPSAELSGAELVNLFAGCESNRGGLRVGFGDLDADGRADVLAGSGQGEEPSNVRVYLAPTVQAGRTNEDMILYPFSPAVPGGVFVG